MPIITAATDDLDNSMMITGINEFQNLHHRGAIMRMNSDAVNFVSCYVVEQSTVLMLSLTIINVSVILVYSGVHSYIILKP